MAGLIILFALYAISPLSRKLVPGGFNRQFVSPDLTRKGVMDIEFNSFYFAGNLKDTLCLGNLSAPFHVLMADVNLTDSQHVKLKVKLDSIKEPKRFRLVVDSPYFFLMHGGMREILRGKPPIWEASAFLPKSESFFVDAVSINQFSFAMRFFSLPDKGYELGKLQSEHFLFNSDLLQKQIDGMFCVEGQLHYNKSLNKLVYLYNYRNEFMVIDTSLVLNYRSHTIDTFTHAKIKVAHLVNNKRILSSPPMRVNGKSAVHHNYLYVQSDIAANNENRESFLTSSVIDVYDLADGWYKHSFYIPNYHGERLSDFKIVGRQMAVIYTHYLVIYDYDNRGVQL